MLNYTLFLESLGPLLQQFNIAPDAQGLWVGDTAPPLPVDIPGHWQRLTQTQLQQLPFTVRTDLACLFLDDEPVNTTDITRLRDVLARQVLILATAHHTTLLRELGFYQVPGFNALPDTINDNNKNNGILWQFNIFDYKQVPDWLNARFWANPQHFNKFRW